MTLLALTQRVLTSPPVPSALPPPSYLRPYPIDITMRAYQAKRRTLRTEERQTQLSKGQNQTLHMVCAYNSQIRIQLECQLARPYQRIAPRSPTPSLTSSHLDLPAQDISAFLVKELLSLLMIHLQLTAVPPQTPSTAPTLTMTTRAPEDSERPPSDLSILEELWMS